MNFNDPQTYISIISYVLLFLSEVLPFLPCKSNGVVDYIIKILKDNQQCIKGAASKVADSNKSDELTNVVTHYTEELLNLRKFKIELEKIVQNLNKDESLDKNEIKKELENVIKEIKNLHDNKKK